MLSVPMKLRTGNFTNRSLKLDIAHDIISSADRRLLEKFIGKAAAGGHSAAMAELELQRRKHNGYLGKIIP